MTAPITPMAYQLTIEPDLNRFTFAGRMILAAEAGDPTGHLVLDCAELAIWSCHLQPGGGDEKRIDLPFTLDPPKTRLTIHLADALSGPFQLTIDYAGKINDRMAGFYRSRIKTGKRLDYIAVTQFQESDARRAFPCLDHPAQKAVFTVEMVIDKHLTAISNTDIQAITELADGRRRVTFHPTPKMSTYLLFFGVGPFEIHEDTDDRRVR
ncbi:MAG: hypothetical protein V2I40_11600, partial [Desulfobacteraceae bacterium]|nr:hypothetical protein [Desulfobacteraceae bacterium]